MAKPTMLVLNRDFTLTTTKGHSIKFEKDVPVYVPSVVYADAIAIGAVAEDGTSADVLDDDTVDDTPVDLAERAELITLAFESLVSRNEREDFTAAGIPKAAAVAKEVGFAVQGKEIAAAWQARNDAAAE